MKYFIDTEFAERPCSIELISLAIVAEDGREFYAESSDFQDDMANEWVRSNVLSQLWSRQSDKLESFNHLASDDGYGGFMDRVSIAISVRSFIGDDKPEFWGYYCDYDWVAFSWLFGSMVDLPRGFPMYCKDIKQSADERGVELSSSPIDGEHHALVDAR